MPGRLFIERSLQDILTATGSVSDELEDPGPRLDIAPKDELWVIDPKRRLRTMRWGMIMTGRLNARRKPVMETIVNARSETLFAKSAFIGVGRCLVPCDGWYEWTGRAGRKKQWRLRSSSGGLLVFAGIYDVWKGNSGIEVPQMATITCSTNKTVGKIHHRMGVLLDEEGQSRWLDGRSVDMIAPPEDAISIESVE